MSKITTKTIITEKDFSNEIIPLCWNRIPEAQVHSNETIDSTIGLFQSGPQMELVTELVSDIDRARQVICVSTFVLQKSVITDALLRAAKRGVRVYLLTASDNQLAKEDFELSEFDRKIIPEHKELLQSFAGSILVRSGEHFHSKFILIDPNSDNAYGFLLTANLTRGALYTDNVKDGKSLGTNFELGVRLSLDQIKDVYHQFLYGFWNEAQHELLGREKLAGVGGAPYQISPRAQSVLWTVGDQRSLKESLLRLIDEAQSSLLLSAWTFEDDHETTKKILEKAASGVDILLLTRNRNMGSLPHLLENGATIGAHERLHGKFIIADGGKGILMTANFTTLGLDSGFETGIWLTPEQMRHLSIVSQEWLNRCRWQLKNDLPRKNIQKEVLVWDRDKLELKSLIESFKENITVQCKTIDEYQNPKYILPDPPDDEIFLKAHYSIEVLPPVLPKKAKPILEETLPRKEKANSALLEALKEFSLYRHQGKIFLEVNEESELEKALDLAQTNKWSVVVRA